MRLLILWICCILSSAASFAQQPASDATRRANAAVAGVLTAEEAEEAELASRGFVATRTDPVIRAADGSIVMNLAAFDFASGAAPDTVNPSLWRHLTLLRQHGLYKVVPGLWQVRGFDLSVMSIIETRNGYVIVDPLTSTEAAKAAMDLVHAHAGVRPVKAVIYTHSHADHYAGVKGIVNEADVQAGRVEIFAPEGFIEETVSESLIAGPAMGRRAAYQFGAALDDGALGQAGAGIGARLSIGTRSFIAPNRIITRTGELYDVDGLKIEFQLTPGTEAPAEMNFYLPDLRALCLAENANPTMHNALPPRGALVRDVKAWSDYLTEAEARYGHKSDVVFMSHGWPRWGNAKIKDYIAAHRDAYKYLHDQTVRLMNKGYTSEEIAEQIALPDTLAAKPYNRGYYGTMRHNSKAIYQRYLGWYDANPANLNAWPPEEAALRYVKAMGGRRKAAGLVKRALKDGDYRWAAEVASHLVFSDRDDKASRELLAQALEQMGYQAEGMLWRNMYLMGAKEARQDPQGPALQAQSPDLVNAIPTASFFDLLAIRVDPEKARGKDLSLLFVFPDRNERIRVMLRNSVLVHTPDPGGPAQATVTLPRPAFLALLSGQVSAETLVQKGTLRLDGDRAATAALLASLDPAQSSQPFAIVVP
jgi:alkyl sulfatase BDS1-like metallo-beta-lactamase superfamily hydrolase